MVIISFLLGLTTTIRAAIIEGQVADSKGNPIAGANIELIGTSYGAATDGSGQFIIRDLPAGDWSLYASHLGFEEDKQDITVSEDESVMLSFVLGEAVVNLDEVVFTATRTFQSLKSVPIATEVISSQTIRNSAATTAAEALESEIGLDVQEDFSGQGVTLQGVDPNKVLILVDGNRVIGRVNGSIDLEQVAATDIKQIEVVKGAVSTLYGSEAIGGVINIITEQADEPFVLSLDASGGGYLPGNAQSFESENYSGSAKLGIRRNKLGLKASVRGSRRGLIDINPTTTHTEGADATDRFNGDFRGEYSDFWGPTTFIVSGRYMDEIKEWQEDSGLTSVNLYYRDVESNSRFDLGTEVLCQPNHNDRYSLKLYRSKNDHIWKKKDPFTLRVIDYSGGEEEFLEASGLITNDLFEDHLLTFGADHYWWKIDAKSELGGIASEYGADLTAWDAYLQDEWKLHHDWTIIPGLRYEDHEIYGGNFSPRLSAMWRPQDDFKVRASVGNGYRAPSSKELYFIFNHASAGYIVYGNPNLVPEKSVNYSLSFEHNYRNSSTARLSFFYNDMRNLIDFDSLTATSDFYTGVYRYENLYAAWTRGFELERGFRFSNEFLMNLSYGYLESENKETGLPLLRRPKHSGRWDITWSPSTWTLKLWGRYVDRTLFTSIWESDDQQSKENTRPYQLWNFTITREFNHDLEVYTKVENIFDHTHERYGPYIGRVSTAGVRWRIAQQE